MNRSYQVLHDESGMPSGYRCNECGTLVRSGKGIKIHLKRVHGIGKQLPLKPDPLEINDEDVFELVP